MSETGWSGIGRPGTACSGCGERLEPCAGEAVTTYATLRIEDGALRRQDYCQGCFEGLSPRPKTFWKRSLERRGAEASPRRGGGKRAKIAALQEMFERLETEEPPGPAEPEAPAPPETGEDKLRYLLALALVRQKKLELVELARAGGADCLVLKRSGQAELLTVPAPPIGSVELERLLDDLRLELER